MWSTTRFAFGCRVWLDSGRNFKETGQRLDGVGQSSCETENGLASPAFGIGLSAGGLGMYLSDGARTPFGVSSSKEDSGKHAKLQGRKSLWMAGTTLKLRETEHKEGIRHLRQSSQSILKFEFANSLIRRVAHYNLAREESKSHEDKKGSNSYGILATLFSLALFQLRSTWWRSLLQPGVIENVSEKGFSYVL